MCHGSEVVGIDATVAIVRAPSLPAMRQRLAEFRAQHLVPGSPGGLIVMAGAVGVGVGVIGAILVESLDLLTDLVADVGEALPTRWLWMFITIPAGLTLATFIAHRFGPEAAGDGVPQVMADLAVRGGRVRRRLMWLKPLVTTISIGSGGSAGREGPIVQIGSSVGAAVARWSHVGEDRIRSLVAAGAGAGIGASFNAPIAGMLFAMEVILGGFAIRHLNTVVVASVTAAVTTRSLIGAELTFPKVQYPLRSAWELLPYAALGILAAVVALAFLRALRGAETMERFRLGLARPVLAGLVVAAAGLISLQVIDQPPSAQVVGTGQSFVAVLLSSTPFVWWALLALVGLKIVATAATLGSGASGGAFAPSLFLGAALGAAFVDFVEPVWGFSELRPGAFALVGMSAVFAAVAKAPLTSILIVFEITQDYGLVLPLMLATTLATLLTDLVQTDSVYTMALRRMGIRLTGRTEVDILDSVAVGDVMSDIPLVAEPSMTTSELQGHLDRLRHHGLPVVDEGRLVGVITVSDIVRTGGPSDQVSTEAAMTPEPTTVTPSTPVSAALERMATLGVGRLPVVADDDAERPVGMFRREDAVAAYHRALEGVRREAVLRDRLRIRTSPGTNFFEFEIPAGSIADGRPVREVAWPEGCTLVSVRRGRDVVVPKGSTMLAAGDVVTAFGTAGVRDRVQMRLRPVMLDEHDIGA